MQRRTFLQIGLSGVTTLSLADLFRLRARADGGNRAARKSLLVVWLHGGASHLETYDPKPLAPSEFRGPFGAIETTAPGVQISELLPRQAATISSRCCDRSFTRDSATMTGRSKFSLDMPCRAAGCGPIIPICFQSPTT